MELNHHQLEQFHNALLSAFPNKAGLMRMLKYKLDWKLNEIAEGQNQTDIIFDLLNHAKANGQLKQLLYASTSANPGNPDLKAFVQQVEEEPSVQQVEKEPSVQQVEEEPSPIDPPDLHLKKLLQPLFIC